MPIRKHVIDEATVRRLSVLADADPRSIRKVLRGGKVRGMAGERVRRVLEEHGYAPTAPQEPAR